MPLLKPTDPIFDPSNFLYLPVDISTGSSSSSGAGATAFTIARDGFFESRNITTGTTTSGAAAHTKTKFILPTTVKSWNYFGGILPSLSTVSEEYIAEIGITDGNATTDITDGCFFRYDRLTNTNWLCVTESGGTETATDSGIAVDTNATDFLIETDVANTSIKFYINGALAATNTTNITSASNMLYSAKMKKSAGTTARSLIYTYVYGIISRN